jgi:DNA repair exonuclease SbcCD ATPase subunit
MIRRGLKPAVFELFCDGELINQTASSKDYQKYLEENVLKINFKSFTQIVILGSSDYVPFMKLPAAHRREIIEDLLDLSIFTKMNILLKKKLETLKDDMDSNEFSMRLLKEKIEVYYSQLKKAKNANNERKSSIESEIDNLRRTNESLIGQLTEAKQSQDIYNNLYTNFESRSRDLVSFKEDLKGLDKKTKFLKDRVKFYETNDNCPTCRQSIALSFKASEIDTAKNNMEQNDGEIQALNTRVRYIENMQEIAQNDLKKLNEITDNVTKISNEIKTNNALINRLKQELERNNDDTEIEAIRNTLTSLGNQFKTLESVKEHLIKSRETMQISGLLLKDTGIKTKIISHYVPVMNKLVNRILESSRIFYQLSA